MVVELLIDKLGKAQHSFSVGMIQQSFVVLLLLFTKSDHFIWFYEF